MSPTEAIGPKRRSLVPGILLGVLGVILLVVAAVIYGVGAVVANVAASPTAEIPERIALDLKAGAYEIYLSDDSTRDMNDPVSAITCLVETDGSALEVSGADGGGISVEDNGNELIGGFTVAAGPGSVACDFTDGHASSDYFYFVRPAAPPLPPAGVVVLVLGALVLVGAAALILRAVFGRVSRAA